MKKTIALAAIALFSFTAFAGNQLKQKKQQMILTK